MNIESLTKELNFDAIADDMFAETFTLKQIKKDFSYEGTLAKPLETLPEDYVWYLENYGSRTIRNMEYRVDINDDTCSLKPFHGCESPLTAVVRYQRDTGTGSYSSYYDEGDFILDQKFLPFAILEEKGQILVLDFKEKIGSIWQFPSLDDCKKFDLEYVPSFVASSFTAFLGLLKPIYSSENNLVKAGYKEAESSSNLWRKNALTFAEIFYQVLADFESNTPTNYLEFKNKKDFLNTLIEQPEMVTVNEARAVEFFYLSYNWKVKNIADFKENIQRIEKQKAKLTSIRENCKLSNLKQLTHTDSGYIGTEHNFFETKLKCLMGGVSCEETFVLYNNPNTKQLSFIKRLRIEKDDLKLNGIGTFSFDYNWKSKRKSKIVWSEISAMLYLSEFEENFTDDYVVFIKKTMNDISFKDTIEQFVFDRYQTIDYPEFLAQDKQTRDEWREAHPDVKTAAEIWQILEGELDIHFIDSQTFDVQFSYSPDPEHGLCLTVKNGKIM